MDRQLTNKLLKLFLISLLFYLTRNSANAFLVHVLKHRLYGDYTLSISLIFAFSQCFSLGVLPSVTKQLPKCLNLRKSSRAFEFIRWNTGLLLKILIAMVAALILIRFTTVFSIDKTYSHNKDTHHYFLLLNLISITPLAIIILWNNRILKACNLTITARIVNSNLLVYLTALNVFIFSSRITTWNDQILVMLVWSAFLLLFVVQSLAVYLRIFRKKFPIKRIISTTVSKIRRRYFFRTGLSMMINSTAYLILAVEAAVLLKLIDHRAASVGHFYIVSKIGALSGLVSISVAYLLNPNYTNITDPERKSRLQSLLSLNATVGFVWLLVSILAFLYLKATIYQYYSINFQGAEFSIILLFVFNYLASGLRRYETICLYNSLNKSLYFISLSQIVITAALCLVLIPKYSYIGAISSNIISETFCFIATGLLLRSRGIKIKVFGIV